jgi:hypothetical protein
MTLVALPEGSIYKYWDNGLLPDATWKDPGFVDVAWEMGAAPLGYGDPHIVTIVDYGPSTSNKYITTWFRASFNVMGAKSVTAAQVEILRDDGAVAYINGTEVARSNMPSGAIMTNTLASGISPDETTFFSFPVDPALLVEGSNVLAVEVHQAVANSSDLGFDARVTLEVPMAP